MKSLRLILVAALFLAPLVALAQSDPNSAPPDSGVAPPEPAIAQQGQPPPPPPDRMGTQRMDQAGPPGGPDGRPRRPGMGAWWKNSQIVSQLQLSGEQVRKIEQTFVDHQMKLIDLRADLEKQELRLQPLLDVDQPDEGKVGAQIDLITAARGRLEKENAMMMLDIRRWLSVEQWKKLQSLREERSQGGPGERRGGPRPEPPPGDVPPTAPGPPPQ